MLCIYVVRRTTGPETDAQVPTRRIYGANPTDDRDEMHISFLSKESKQRTPLAWLEECSTVRTAHRKRRVVNDWLCEIGQAT